MDAQRFRKKPVEIEAVHFTGDTIGKFGVPAIAKWCGGQVGFREGRVCIVISTLEGDMVASLGDWIIKEPFPTDDRLFYPCKPEIFEATYEPINSLGLTRPPRLDQAADEGMGL